MLLWCGGAAALGGQQPSPDSRLAAFGDSLAEIRTPAALQLLEAASRTGGSTAGLRRAMYLVRRGELTHRRQDLDDVIQQVHAGGSPDPWAALILAESYAALEFGGWRPDKPDGLRGAGESFADAVWRNVRIALDRDSNFTFAESWVLPKLVAGGDRLLRDDEIALVKRMVHRTDLAPDALLVWGRHLRTLRLYDSALAVFARAVRLGGDASVLALERARTLRALHDSTAASAAYWEGLKELTPAGRALYRYDISWIVGKDSVAAFDALPDSAVAPWMRRFWEERDAAATNLPGQRLTEHLRRWVVAFERYRVRSPWRRTMYDRIDLFFENDDCLHLASQLYTMLWELPPVLPGDLRQREWLLDHRGLIYLRHGEPTVIFNGGDPLPDREDFVSGVPVTTPDTTAAWTPWAMGKEYDPLGGYAYGPEGRVAVGPPRQNRPRYSESWLYDIDGHLQLLHFRDSYAIGMYGPTTLASVLPFSPSAWLGVAGSLAAYRAAAERLASEFRRRVPPRQPSCLQEVQAADARSRSDMAKAMEEDSDAPPLLRHWDFRIGMYGLGDDRWEPGQALLTFALGGAGFAGETLPDGRTLYRLRFRVVAWEHTTGRVVRLDTMRLFVRDSPVPIGNSLTSYLELPLTQGTWQVAARVTQGADSTGAYALRRSVRIGDGAELALSDLVLGLVGSPEWSATDGAPFPVNALERWPAGSDLELFFELFGVASGTSAKSTIELRPLDPKFTGRSIRIASTTLSTGTVMHFRKSLGLRNLSPGHYQLTVTVEAGGRRVARSMGFVVAESQ